MSGVRAATSEYSELYPGRPLHARLFRTSSPISRNVGPFEMLGPEGSLVGKIIPPLTLLLLKPELPELEHAGVFADRPYGLVWRPAGQVRFDLHGDAHVAVG